MTFDWEKLADGVFRCRLPFLDVTVGLVCGRDGVLLIDSGSTLTEANAIEADVRHIAQRHVERTEHLRADAIRPSRPTPTPLYGQPRWTQWSQRVDGMRSSFLVMAPLSTRLISAGSSGGSRNCDESQYANVIQIIA